MYILVAHFGVDHYLLLSILEREVGFTWTKDHFQFQYIINTHIIAAI